MAINLKKTTKKDIASIKGLRLGVASAGIKDDTTDLLVIALPDNSNVAGLFTQNQFYRKILLSFLIKKLN